MHSVSDITEVLERTRKGRHRQSDEHWNCFKGNVGGLPLRDEREHIIRGFHERVNIDTIMN